MWGKKKTTPTKLREGIITIYRTALKNGVSLDQVENRVSRFQDRLQVTHGVEENQAAEKTDQLKRQLPLSMRIISTTLPVVLVVLGLFLIGNAVVPIAGYYVSTFPDLRARQLQTPIPPEEVMQGFPQVFATEVEVEPERVLSEPVVLTGQLDYTNLSNWFTGLATSEAVGEHEYTLSIPSLDVVNATVKVGGTNLNTSLIQYPGTADPGQAGAPVIFGHSVLRQFYNPDQDNKRRYISIFSYIMTMKNGDKIYIKDGDVNYTYEVVDKLEVKPEDTYVLAQNPSEKLLKLITCVPEGTYLRRGVIVARLVK